VTGKKIFLFSGGEGSTFSFGSARKDYPAPDGAEYTNQEANGMKRNQEYDSIWLGGGAAGRFGAAFHKALGGKPLLIEMCHLGGQ